MFATPAGCRRIAFLLIAVSVGLNLAYLICGCPLELSPDEAHYWHWSRRLDWSYYSKGPLIAWLMHGSCELFGDLSIRLVGSEMLAVRLPAVGSHAAFLVGLFVLTEQTLRSSRLALALLVMALAFPPITAAAIISTIDPPFLACWCWSLVAVGKAVSSDQIHWWLIAGLISLVGVLAKYPMLLLPVLVGSYLTVHRHAAIRGAGYWSFVLLTMLGCVPVLIWNVQNDWASLKHVSTQSGLLPPSKPKPLWVGFGEYVGGQFGLLLGAGFIAFIAAAWHYRKSGDSQLALAWWCSVPAWCAFASVSLRTGGQMNWAAPAYISGAVLTTGWLQLQYTHGSRIRRGIILMAISTMFAIGCVISLLLHYPSLYRPLLAHHLAVANDLNRLPIRKIDPTCRLNGWRTLAREVDVIRLRVVRDTGREPAIACMVWTVPGELAFYCREHPEVHSFGLVLGDRHSQYDYWRPNPVFDAQVFLGRTFIYVGDAIPDAERVFERIEPPRCVIHRERGIPLASWTIWVCHGYRGFATDAAPHAGY